MFQGVLALGGMTILVTPNEEEIKNLDQEEDHHLEISHEVAIRKVLSSSDARLRRLYKNKEIRIDRLDEFGCDMTSKQAFKEFSIKFHGKRPGFKRKEKRFAAISPRVEDEADEEFGGTTI
ncbi:hypothetical protein TIFTF001_044885 [Ficus carica]|uniref:Uncharacterized protein n=1 Tax=Ficus carica TaxID=3494 RepID=A0AA87ZJR6_FICCA|nr:hypothetical protein TIFTF001_044885 [Ficus carica]